MKTNNLEQTLLSDPSTSNWLKEQLDLTKSRDPVDALNDAEVLVTVLESRLNTVTQRQQDKQSKG
ncbi:TPA: hypothetical protein P7L42_003347 [Vibrio cholerae]|uniref:hypothetical protein n=1 Tax=Vibrio cholerae TaxID=666 RepID=UPI0013BF0476|nr:hypothetical protein [Vibrio cholerae]MCX9672199.1 hypothetical protein [Vibrio cholerae]MCX9680765.1 hypothetical protein [Vibrio cholerae]MCX9686862.1 hypothetical protein [Vibrio cholerae]MCX9698345.1 hypothetical protein [Vibrio cholerae]MCX9716058.1 hypothetical protein [Vibrio cholerae]